MERFSEIVIVIRKSLLIVVMNCIKLINTHLEYKISVYLQLKQLPLSKTICLKVISYCAEKKTIAFNIFVFSSFFITLTLKICIQIVNSFISLYLKEKVNMQLRYLLYLFCIFMFIIQQMSFYTNSLEDFLCNLPKDIFQIEFSFIKNFEVPSGILYVTFEEFFSMLQSFFSSRRDSYQYMSQTYECFLRLFLNVPLKPFINLDSQMMLPKLLFLIFSVFYNTDA